MAMNIAHFIGYRAGVGIVGWTVSPLNPAISLAEISFTFF
jgi:hypothetical protein